MVLTFAGNEVTTPAGLLDGGGDGGRAVKLDQIREGRLDLFSGSSSAKQLLWITAPALFILHAISVIATLRTRNEQMSSYCSRSVTQPQNGLLHKLLVLALNRQLCLAACSVVVMILIVMQPTVYECTDIVYRSTIANASTDSQFFCWAYVIFCGLALLMVSAWMETLSRSRFSTRAKQVYSSFRLLVTAPQQAAVESWCSKMPPRKSPNGWRWLLWGSLHIPLMGLTFLPDMAFVWALNIPTSNVGISIISNSLFVALVKLTFSTCIVPPLSACLARIRFGDHAHCVKPELVIKVYKTRSWTSLLVEISAIIAPVFAVALIDDSCLR